MIFVAPGKVVVLGEYAVLDGAPAIVAAVDSGVACEVTPSHDIEVSTPGDDRFVRPALDAAAALPARYAFTDWNPPETATKAGVGGSAAAVVCALLAAWSLQGEAPSPPRLHEVGHRVHHAVQGTGSGIDVAASAYGGLVWFEGGSATPMDLALEPVVVWSGRSADTAPRLAAYLSWSDRADFVARSAQIVHAFAEDPIRALRDARHALEAMAERAGLDYRTPALDRIAALAEGLGGAAKPSGAGGGDVAVALLPDPAAAARFREACAEARLQVLPVRLAPGAHRAR